MKNRKRGLIVAMLLGIITFSICTYAGTDSQRGHGGGENGKRPGPGPGDGPGPGPGPGPAGEAPSAMADNATTSENTPVTINVVANDTDTDGDLNVATVDLDPAPGLQQTFSTPKGDYSVDADGIVTFTPKTDFNGSAVLGYTVSDSTGLASNEANITIDVTSVNAAPVAVDDTGSVVNDAEVQLNILANDSDSDGKLDTSKVDLNTSLAGIQKSFKGTEGDWTVAKGVLKFKPKPTFTGSAALTYIVYDDEDAPSNVATVTITVTDSNVAPVAVNDTGGTTLNKPVSINVVANDTDSDGTIDKTKVDLNVTAAGVQTTASTAQGAWSVDAQGLVTYTPIALFLGNASLKYTVMDNKGAVSNQATITVTVQAINLAPVANNDNVTTSKNTAVTIKVTQNDSDIDGVIDPAKVDLNTTLGGIQNTAETEQGTYSVDAQGIVTYTPTTNFTGVAALTYTVTDNAGAVSNIASINITVQNVNSAPVAMDDTGATSQNITTTVNVVANDTDSDGVIDAAKVDLKPAQAGIQNTADTPDGNYTVSNIGIVTYKPKKDFTGTATLTYTVNDNNNAVSNVATITIAVQPENAPIAKQDTARTSANTQVDINIVANDSDPDGTIDATSVDLNVSKAGVQKNNTTPEGSFVVDDDGLVTYSPKKDFAGIASLEYTVKDNKGVLSNIALITITVEAIPNEAPEIVAFEEPGDTLRYTPGNPMTITDEFEADDADDDSLAVAEIGFVGDSYSAGSDKFIFEDTQKIKGSFDAQTGLLKLTGSALIRDYNRAVQSVKYEYTAGTEHNSGLKRIYVRVSDGKEFSDLKQRVIRIFSEVKDLDIPTAFTPNSDGANDTWRILAPTDISGSDFADAQIMVFDKRGTVVFDANGIGTAWDGTYQGKQLPVDTYYYTIDLKQQQKRYKGVVVILR